MPTTTTVFASCHHGRTCSSAASADASKQFIRLATSASESTVDFCAPHLQAFDCVQRVRVHELPGQSAFEEDAENCEVVSNGLSADAGLGLCGDVLLDKFRTGFESIERHPRKVGNEMRFDRLPVAVRRRFLEVAARQVLREITLRQFCEGLLLGLDVSLRIDLGELVAKGLLRLSFCPAIGRRAERLLYLLAFCVAVLDPKDGSANLAAWIQRCNYVRFWRLELNLVAAFFDDAEVVEIG